jgi:DNA mismatch repair ATPase MutL
LLVDLKGAEARILYEKMSKESCPEPLLWPLEMDCDVPEETVELLKGIGIESRALGKRRLAIDALPSGMKETLAVEFIRHYSVERKLAASLTRICRSRAKKFSLEEGSMIWEKLQLAADRNYDPLGKRIASPLSEDDLAKQFE